MTNHQLTDHFAKEKVQVMAMADMRKPRFILGADRLPIRPMHASVIEKVALNAPHFVEHLPPFGAWIDIYIQLIKP